MHWYLYKYNNGLLIYQYKRTAIQLDRWFMLQSIKILDIVNTLMLYDLTFNSFRAVQWDLCVHPHSYDGRIACGRACSHESGPSGGHDASRRAPLSPLQLNIVRGAAGYKTAYQFQFVNFLVRLGETPIFLIIYICVAIAISVRVL